MESPDWSNLRDHELEETLRMPVYGQIQTPDSLSSVFPLWDSKSGVLTSWGSDINPKNALIPDSGMTIPRGIRDSLEHIEPGISTSTSSVQSLDCFLSASNSLTDTTSVEDDGISRFFSSDSKGPWHFTAVKPVPSMSLSGNQKRGLDTGAALAQTPPADKHTIINQSRSSGNQNQANHTKTGCENLDFLESNYAVTACHPGRTSFQATSQIHPIAKKPRLDKHPIQSLDTNPSSQLPDPNTETIDQMKEMIYRAAVFRPVDFTTESVEKPRRKNVRISSDPQTVAARQRRERISVRIRLLQKLVPGGSKMDTASMLDEAANYLKFLRAQVRELEAIGHNINDQMVTGFPGNVLCIKGGRTTM